MATANQILEIAWNEVGYVEKPVNRTKYAKEFGQDGSQWCQWFVCWVFKEAKHRYIRNGYTPNGVAHFKALRQWHTEGDILPGDILFFDFPDEINRVQHTGIAVSELKSGLILTIEGNTSDGGSQTAGGAVMLKERSRSLIVGWGRPVYKPADTPIVKEIRSFNRTHEDFIPKATKKTAKKTSKPKGKTSE